MGGLKFAILGLVNRSPVTGYDITKRFHDSVSKFWEANHSQIYPELKRLVDDGLVEYRVMIQGEKLEKKLYTITDKGREQLLEWLNTDEDIPPPPKDAFRLRMYFSENLSKAELLDLSMGQLDKHLERIATFEARYNLLTELNTDGSYSSEMLIVKGGLYRERAYVEWIHECLRSFELEK